MEIKRKGHAQELLCSVCDQMFAQVWPDRLLIFSRHFGDIHTGAVSIPGLTKILNAALANEVLPLDCACGRLPSGMVEFGRLIIESQHKVGKKRQKHPNVLMPEDLQALIDYFASNSDTIAPGADELRQAS